MFSSGLLLAIIQQGHHYTTLNPQVLLLSIEECHLVVQMLGNCL